MFEKEKSKVLLFSQSTQVFEEWSIWWLKSVTSGHPVDEHESEANSGENNFRFIGFPENLEFVDIEIVLLDL